METITLPTRSHVFTYIASKGFSWSNLNKTHTNELQRHCFVSGLFAIKWAPYLDECVLYAAKETARARVLNVNYILNSKEWLNSCKLITLKYSIMQNKKCFVISTMVYILRVYMFKMYIIIIIICGFILKLVATKFSVDNTMYLL